MAKWADCVITKVRYDEDHGHIEQLRVADDEGEKLGPARDESRATVVRNLQSKTYITGPPSDDGKISKGALVGTVTVNNVVYLRTDANYKAGDNLGELPEY